MTRTERTHQTLAALAAARGVSVSDAEAALTAGIAIGAWSPRRRSLRS
jgi:hypothetical protein